MIHYANPDETTFTGAHFMFSFGAYGDTKVCVIHKPGRVEAALELAAEWLDENAPGVFNEPDYLDAKQACSVCSDAPEDTDPCDKCIEAAETGHTRTEAGWLLSHEWHVDEFEGEPEEMTGAHFDRYDIIEAWFCYWNAWHGGQFTDGYRNLCRAMSLGKLRDNCDQFDHLSENGKAIYRGLVLKDGR